MEKVKEFKGVNRYLSNFYSIPVEYQGLIYMNNEAAFQSAKCLDKSNREVFTKLSPDMAKRLGRRVVLRKDWEDIKVQVMYEIVKDKFTRNTQIGNKLKATGNSILEEGNIWHDNIWGNCTCYKCKNIIGKNELGKILMRVRSEI